MFGAWLPQRAYSALLLEDGVDAEVPVEPTVVPHSCAVTVKELQLLDQGLVAMQTHGHS